jgi:hypothetical protein
MMGRKAVGRLGFGLSDARDNGGREKCVRMCCRLPAPFEQEARDDVLGGIPTTAIAGLFLTSTFHAEIITPSQVPSVQNWTCFKPEARKQGDLGRSAEKSNAEVQRSNREEKKGAAAIAFERERGYKKKAQRKRCSTRPDVRDGPG